ncbi:putative bifunctional diguanylate cyclase/phosphodiesterase [Brumicola nitratireducens]|uniref:Diguanylate cyclase/phosphodiesterase n=1 Tax=Glaciecola nitratireducens (strain JCM 12485 / KCTC 12276 / FR1064) TaxID=1085623 RepID=G4QJ89_GLANF|nr:GGDEF domain-containing phosphodiesterase [Glaciecola nitratireducens]AEP31232.1 diguanylate cyclase/phosphodiesterase [Glaciecola nitratireducens FR1064]
MQPSLIQALGIIDCAVFKLRSGSVFEVVQSTPSWVSKLVPSINNGDNVDLAEVSLFLTDFLIDAHEFWKLHSSGQVHSGIWTEALQDDDNLHLEAIAASAGPDQYLVINNVNDAYVRQQETLQVARELLISNDRVIEKHDYMHERLRSVLMQQHLGAEGSLPIREAIQYASIGVVITDIEFHISESNPSSYKIFEMEVGLSDQSPIDVILNLLNKQFPEKDRIFETQSGWTGELYWHLPPNYHKWIQLGIHPVKDENGNLCNWIFTTSDVTRVKYLLQTNEDLSLHDALTKLPNRQYFWQTLDQTIASQTPFYVIYLDISNFKNINELYGHLTGDQLLTQVAQRLRNLVPERDFIARIGADEFAIVHFAKDNVSKPDFKTYLDDTIKLTQELSAASNEPYYTNKDRRCELPLKIGVSTYPSDAGTVEELMKYADLALHHAKQTGTDPIQFYSLDLKIASERRLMLEEALRHAIEKEQFELYVQPIYDLRTNTIVKAEALLRWHISDDEMISPDIFIPIAEQSGQIVAIGRWVISSVCELLAQMSKQNLSVPLSLNLSPRQISDRHLFDFINNAVIKNKVSPDLLELEITEGVLVDNHEKVRKLLQELREMGVTVAIDDFGTGYSSLSYLKYLPIDSLKIDQSFVFDLGYNSDDQAIVLAVIAMAKSLKLGVVAEGIETQQQKDFLEQHDCIIGQGFLLSRPLTIYNFIKLVEQNYREIRG